MNKADYQRGYSTGYWKAVQDINKLLTPHEITIENDELLEIVYVPREKWEKFKDEC